ncbi:MULTISPECIES: FtsX-like permease family protein [Stenotrophomonas]|uniref:ABC transporter permease n=1 Tax=Stenotrophomonas TaxID=40323 RepID=UPI0007704DA7|nr:MULTISPECIES: FtsX-like permease family protein [Stenotrophomonas]AMJ56364.1 ABC transporter permease [Stenotrophomonas sp. KCTC 12332]
MDLLPIFNQLMRHKTASLLLVLEIALSCAIICNAVFIISNRVNELRIQSGVADDELVYLATSSLLPDVNSDALRQQDVQALTALPGVKAASSVNQIPYGGNVWGSDIRLQAGQTRPTAHASIYMDDGHLLQTYGLQVVEGRSFLPDEYIENSAFNPNKIGPTVPSILLGKTLAQRLFPGDSPIGKRVYIWGEEQPPSTVVGVVKDLMAPGEGGTFANRYDSVIFPIRVSNGAYALRTTPEQRQSVLKAATTALNQQDPNRIIEQQDTLEQMRSDFHQRDRAVIWLLLSVCAALLAVTAFGIIGQASFWVQQRTRQIGIRRALGATRRHILRYFQLENFLLSSAGIVLGLLLAYALNMLLMNRYELPRLPLYYLPASAIVLWLLGQLAVLGPARRAASIPPAVATRSL